MARRKLGDILLEANMLSKEQLDTALAEQQVWGGSLGKILVEKGFVSEEVLVRALSLQLNVPAVHIGNAQIPREVIDLLSLDMCERYCMIPFRMDTRFLDVAMVDPKTAAMVEDLRMKTKRNVRVYLAAPSDIRNAIAVHYKGTTVGDANLGRGMEFELSDSGVLKSTADARRGGTPIHGIPTQHMKTPEVWSAIHGISDAPSGPILSRRPTPVVQVDDQVEYQIGELRSRVEQLEALVARDEDVIRKLMGLLIRKGVCTRDEIMDQIKS
jgi:hypothetical protein